MCRVSKTSPFNLSQESLTGPAALQALKRLPETDPAFWSILMKNKATIPNVEHSDYDGAEDDDPNEESAALKYEDDHSIPSDVLRNHILHGDVAQHGGLESDNGDIIPSSISETINNDAADTEHDFEDLNEDVLPPQDLPEQPNDLFELEISSNLVATSGAQTPSEIVSPDVQLMTGGQLPAKRARRVNVLYSGMFWEKH